MEIRTLDNIDYLVLDEYRIYHFYLAIDGLLSPRRSAYEEGVRFLNEAACKSLALALANDLGINGN